jgi:hypothetical protein
MIADTAGSLLIVMGQVSDPRARRGVRFPFASLLSLVFVGLLGRHTEFAAIRRWASTHWDVLCEPLGFDPRYGVPCATTLSRAMARFPLAQFQQAFSSWLRSVVNEDGLVAAAVDGKTSRNGLRESGDPIAMLNVFAQDVKACLGQWPLTGDKLTEPEVLKAHLDELFATYPALRLLTGDALYSQRNLAEIIVASGHDYLFQIKGNQPDILDAMRHCFAVEKRGPATCKTQEKKGARSKLVFFGSTSTMPNMCAMSWVLPVAECSSKSTEPCETVADWYRSKRGTSSPASTRPQ